MMVDNQPLTKILNTASMFNLNHGDNKTFILSGTEGVAGQDSNK